MKFKLKERIADREFRGRSTVSLKQIADATGIHRVTLSKLANNKKYNVGVDTLDKLCRYFECGIGDLVEYVPDAEVTRAFRRLPGAQRTQ